MKTEQDKEQLPPKQSLSTKNPGDYLYIGGPEGCDAWLSTNFTKPPLAD